MVDYFKKQKIRFENLLSIDEDGWLDYQNQLRNLQHERLVHLLVMLMVGISVLTSSLVTLSVKSKYLMLFDGALLILFLAYVIHYQRLENMTQGWYKLGDRLRGLKDK